MKKTLLATSALVAFTGAAVADVELSGRAEMGIFGSSDVGDAQFFTDIDVTFTMSGETDNGLTFGASVDLDEGGSGAAAVADNSDDGGATIFISGSFGTVTMGDTDGALDWALTEAGNVGNPGSLADDETSHSGYLGSYLDGAQDGQILRWDYSSGPWGVAISLEDDNGSDLAGSNIGWAIGFKYGLEISGGTIDFGIGYQEAADIGIVGTAEAVGVSIAGNFDNGFSAGIVYTDFDNAVVDDEFALTPANPVDDHIGVGVGYESGPVAVHLNYGEYSGNSAAGGFDQSGIGFAAAYDLGGGAVVHFGYGKGESDNPLATFDFERVSFGLGLSF